MLSKRKSRNNSFDEAKRVIGVTKNNKIIHFYISSLEKKIPMLKTHTLTTKTLVPGIFPPYCLVIALGKALASTVMILLQTVSCKNLEKTIMPTLLNMAQQCGSVSI